MSNEYAKKLTKTYEYPGADLKSPMAKEVSSTETFLKSFDVTPADSRNRKKSDKKSHLRDCRVPSAK
jgi:hypothetical protein